jgi:putative chitinase
VSKAFGIDFVSNPQLLEEPEWAARSAGLFWYQNKLNVIADLPAAPDSTDPEKWSPLQRATKKINGGLSHYAERKGYYLEALKRLP